MTTAAHGPHASPRRAHAWLAGVGLLVGAAAAAPCASQADSAALRAQLSGTWTLAVPIAGAEETRDRAVAQAVEAMPFYARPIARPRLRDGHPIDRSIELRFVAPDRLNVRFGSRADYTSQIGQTQRAQRRDGTPIRVTQRFRPDGALEQVFESEEGTRWYLYRPTGETLRLEITTDSDRMPQPLHYALPYRRANAEGTADRPR